MKALYACAIFLSSLLLFLIQPVIAKLIVPWFGGSSAVWITCLVFFQTMLLLGYLYAHLLTSRVRPEWQALVHIAMLAGALTLLPVIPASSWKPSGGAMGNPAWRILWLLTAVIGLPYFLLSSTSPLLQTWHARRWPGSPPWRLFALSNIAALLALASYPFLIEPALATRTQALGWSFAFAGFTVLCAAVAWGGRKTPALEKRESAAVPPSARDLVTWIALAAAGSMLLLATTNQLTQNVAAVPFLWILPLALYLLTFVLCFGSVRWYPRAFYLRLLAVAIGSIGYAIYDLDVGQAIVVAVPVFAGGMFVACMFCHGELSLRTPDASHLTTFYLMIALGGALGSIFVGLVVPRIFLGIYDLAFALMAVSVLVLAVNWSGGWLQRLLWVTVLAASAFVFKSQVDGYHKSALALMRSFYGSLHVARTSLAGYEVRKLYHGVVQHGSQSFAPGKHLIPTSYYGVNSGVGMALRYVTDGPKRVGAIGLGAGTIAAFGKQGDVFHFYEINSQVIDIAGSLFSYTRETPAHVEITLGDARLSLESEPSQAFDVLVVDAFSGDAIPVHLLTKEAFALYFRHLKSSGILAVHVSNQYLELAPVCQQLANSFAYPAIRIRTKDDETRLLTAADWLLITLNRDVLGQPEIIRAAEPIPFRKGLRIWTDNYNNLMQILKLIPPR